MHHIHTQSTHFFSEDLPKRSSFARSTDLLPITLDLEFTSSISMYLHHSNVLIWFSTVRGDQILPSHSWSQHDTPGLRDPPRVVPTTFTRDVGHPILFSYILVHHIIFRVYASFKSSTDTHAPSPASSSPRLHIEISKISHDLSWRHRSVTIRQIFNHGLIHSGTSHSRQSVFKFQEQHRYSCSFTSLFNTEASHRDLQDLTRFVLTSSICYNTSDIQFCSHTFW